jgi:ABC-type phosphate/phosphonate transport system substrate-binding protein
VIASLPMYETHRTHGANDRFWQAILGHLGTTPTPLDRSTDPHVTWRHPDLFLSQTCGMPFRTGLCDIVQLLGTPDYGVPGCPPGYYRSYLVVREDDPRQTLAAFDGAHLARNDARSQSGWAAVVTHLRAADPELGFAPEVLHTGSHRASLRAVAEGRADIAGCDAVTWALLSRDTDATHGLRILEATEPTPGLPFITGPEQDAARIRDALRHAVSALTAPDREALMLTGLADIPAEDYLAVHGP